MSEDDPRTNPYLAAMLMDDEDLDGRDPIQQEELARRRWPEAVPCWDCGERPATTSRGQCSTCYLTDNL